MSNDMRTGSGDSGELFADLWDELMNFLTLGMAERWRWEAEREAGD